jgi:NAD(P)-dependent dehydrogenase (short-subunit alcohol dehydrogenase family)
VNRLVLVARTIEKAIYAKTQIELELETYRKKAGIPPHLVSDPKYVDWTENLIPLACDQTSFDSVRQFNHNLRLKLMRTYRGHKWALNGIDVLCLNAAYLAPKDPNPQLTSDGFEMTFQTNHLSPFLLSSLLSDLMTPGGRVVVTTSGLYKMEKLRSMAGLEKIAKDSITSPHELSMTDKENVSVHTPSPSPSPTDVSTSSNDDTATNCTDMIDGSEYHHKRCYAMSKLCNTAFCVGLNNVLQSRKNGSFAVCFSPGLIRKTGLFRNQDESSINWHENPDVLKQEKSTLWGAGSLVYMSISDEVARVGGAYYWGDACSNKGSNARYGKDFAPSLITDENFTPEQVKKLWQISQQLVHMTSNTAR